MITPELYTQRLFLRKIEKEDEKAIFHCWMSDEKVSRYMLWNASQDMNETKEFVKDECQLIESDQWYRWIIVLKDVHEIIGTCLIYFNEERNNWDISYNLGQKYWGNGYMLEAMKEVMRFAKENLHIKECIAIHAKENIASCRIIQKLGFQYIKEVPYSCQDSKLTTGKYYLYKFYGEE